MITDQVTHGIRMLNHIYKILHRIELCKQSVYNIYTSTIHEKTQANPSQSHKCTLSTLLHYDISMYRLPKLVSVANFNNH